MPVHPVERKLAAIFAADIAGYSRLMARDEIGTLARLKACRAIIDELIASHRGRIFNTAGDSVVADFASAVDAVQCAVAVQTAIAGENSDRAADESMQFRIGVHVGDVMVDGDNLLGDGVNIAARLEASPNPARSAFRRQRATTSATSYRSPSTIWVISGSRTSRRRSGCIGCKWKSRRHNWPPPCRSPTSPRSRCLPFQNISGDPEQEYFADGMVEEIITALSRIHWLFVIARNSSFTYKGQAVDVKQVGRELGVRYVLEGSVRKAGMRVRITGQLIDALTGTHLWADRFDGSLEDVFDLQDKIAVSVAGVIEPALQAAEMRRSAARPTTDLTAYDLYLRALAVSYPITKERIIAALGLLEQAIAIDPHYGPALSLAASCHMHLDRANWAEEPETNRRKGIDLARQALQAGENDPGILANAAVLLAYFGEDIGAMIGLIDRALALNPSFARGWHASGTLRIWAGQHDLAIEHLETSLRLSPRERIGQPLFVMGMAYFFKHQFDEAAAKLLLAMQDQPGSPPTYRFLAACYAHMGRLDEARTIVARLRAITPQVVPSDLPYRNPEDRELFLSGLRLAIGETVT